MAQARELLVRILADTSKLNSELQATNNKLAKWGQAAKVAGGVFAAGLIAEPVIDFLGDATAAAEEDAKAQRLLATQLRETTGASNAQIASAEQFINTLARQTGVMDDDLRPAYAALVRGTKDTEQANQELAVAMDIAAARGVSLETVTAALEKAHNGNIGALGRLGVATKDAEGNTLSLTQAMANAATTYAGAAEAAVTPSQKWNVAFQELKEQIGTALLPALTKITDWLASDFLPAVQNAITWIETNWPKFQHAVETAWSVVGPILTDTVRFIKLIGDVVVTMVKVVSDLLHGDFSKAWRDARDGIVDVFEDIYDFISGIVERIIGVLKTMVEFILSIPSKIAGIGKKILDEIVGGAGGLVGKVISHLPGFASGGIVTSPTLAMVGEKGPEAIVPLNARGGFGGGVVQNYYSITVNSLDPSTAGPVVVRAINDYARTNGGLRVPGGVTAVS